MFEIKIAIFQEIHTTREQLLSLINHRDQEKIMKSVYPKESCPLNRYLRIAPTASSVQASLSSATAQMASLRSLQEHDDVPESQQQECSSHNFTGNSIPFHHSSVVEEASDALRNVLSSRKRLDDQLAAMNVAFTSSLSAPSFASCNLKSENRHQILAHEVDVLLQQLEAEATLKSANIVCTETPACSRSGSPNPSRLRECNQDFTHSVSIQRNRDYRDSASKMRQKDQILIPCKRTKEKSIMASVQEWHPSYRSTRASRLRQERCLQTKGKKPIIPARTTSATDRKCSRGSQFNTKAEKSDTNAVSSKNPQKAKHLIPVKVVSGGSSCHFNEARYRNGEIKNNQTEKLETNRTKPILKPFYTSENNENSEQTIRQLQDMDVHKSIDLEQTPPTTAALEQISSKHSLENDIPGMSKECSGIEQHAVTSVCESNDYPQSVQRISPVDENPAESIHQLTEEDSISKIEQRNRLSEQMQGQDQIIKHDKDFIIKNDYGGLAMREQTKLQAGQDHGDECMIEHDVIPKRDQVISTLASSLSQLQQEDKFEKQQGLYVTTDMLYHTVEQELLEHAQASLASLQQHNSQYQQTSNLTLQENSLSMDHQRSTSQDELSTAVMQQIDNVLSAYAGAALANIQAATHNSAQIHERAPSSRPSSTSSISLDIQQEQKLESTCLSYSQLSSIQSSPALGKDYISRCQTPNFQRSPTPSVQLPACDAVSVISWSSLSSSPSSQSSPLLTPVSLGNQPPWSDDETATMSQQVENPCVDRPQRQVSSSALLNSSQESSYQNQNEWRLSSNAAHDQKLPVDENQPMHMEMRSEPNLLNSLDYRNLSYASNALHFEDSSQPQTLVSTNGSHTDQLQNQGKKVTSEKLSMCHYESQQKCTSLSARQVDHNSKIQGHEMVLIPHKEIVLEAEEQWSIQSRNSIDTSPTLSSGMIPFFIQKNSEVTEITNSTSHFHDQSSTQPTPSAYHISDNGIETSSSSMSGTTSASRNQSNRSTLEFNHTVFSGNHAFRKYCPGDEVMSVSSHLSSGEIPTPNETHMQHHKAQPQIVLPQHLSIDASETSKKTQSNATVKCDEEYVFLHHSKHAALLLTEGFSVDEGNKLERSANVSSVGSLESDTTGSGSYLI